MEIQVLKQAEKELKSAPKDIKEDIFSLFEELEKGVGLTFQFIKDCTN